MKDIDYFKDLKNNRHQTASSVPVNKKKIIKNGDSKGNPEY